MNRFSRLWPLLGNVRPGDWRPRRIMLMLGSFPALALVAAVAIGEPQPPQLQHSGAGAIQLAIAQLLAEAQLIKLRDSLPSQSPDFARRCDERPASVDVAAALIQRQHDDPFIDAYVRWQLTSFEPTLPSWSDSDFFGVMNDAPALMPNPRANDDLIHLVELAESSSRMEPAVTERLRMLLADLDARELNAEAMNLPALGWRDWIGSKLGGEGARPRQWLIERCTAMLVAGWPVRTVKMRITRSLEAVDRDSTITYSQRVMLAEQLDRLRDRERRLVTRVIFAPDDAIVGRYARTGVSDDELEEWKQLLTGDVIANVGTVTHSPQP